MDILITGIRIWCTFICIIFLLLLGPLIFIAETIALVVAIFPAAIFMSKDDMKQSWIGSYSNVIRKIRKSIPKLWDWALIELNEDSIFKIILSAMVGILTLGLPLCVYIILIVDLIMGILKNIVSIIIIIIIIIILNES